MKKFIRTQLEPGNEKELDAQISNKRLADVYGHLLRLLAQICDSAASGDNTYCTLGATKDKSAVVITVITPEGRSSLYAASLGGLAIQCDSLL